MADSYPRDDDSPPYVLVERPRPHVAVVRLHRPARLNALSIELVSELHDTLGAIGDENDTWVVVLTGAGRAFCSGLDLKDYGVVPNIDGLQVGRIAQRAMRHYSRLVPLLRRMPQPVIAAVNGPAYGGGMCLALGADLRFAGDVGHVQRHRHRQRAHLHRDGRLLAAPPPDRRRPLERPAAHRPGRRRRRRPWRMGLVSRVLPDDELLDACLEVAGSMAAFSPYGLAMTKDVLWANLEIASLEAAVELEDRNQLMLGLHREPPRGHPRLRRRAGAGVHGRAPPRDVPRVTPDDPGWFSAETLLGTFRIMFLAVVGVLILVGNVVLVVYVTGDGGIEPNRLVTAGVVAVGIASLVLPGILDPGLDCSTHDALVASYRTWFVMRIGIAESAALVGFASFLITGEAWHYPLGAAFTAIGLARVAPADVNLARLEDRLALDGCPVSLVDALTLERRIR